MTMFHPDIQRLLRARAGLVESFEAETIDRIGRVAEALSGGLREGRVVYACGNGGSATQATHFAAELVGRYQKERRALPAFALNDNVATVTAVANDYSFDEVFARQIAGMGRPGDCLLAISTSGNSRNVVRACEAAKERNMVVCALTGAGGGRVASASDIAVVVPAADTPLVQELHLAVIHILCHLVEDALFPAS